MGSLFARANDWELAFQIWKLSSLAQTDQSPFPHNVFHKYLFLFDLDANVFIGNQLESVSDVEEKLSIFIAKYSYDPMLYSPNDNPETELAFQAGDYLYVYGDIDEVSGNTSVLCSFYSPVIFHRIYRFSQLKTVTPRAM